MPVVDGCQLARRIKIQPYIVVGSDIDAHGDARGPIGFCMTKRRAKTIGEIQGDKFVAASFKRQP